MRWVTFLIFNGLGGVVLKTISQFIDSASKNNLNRIVFILYFSLLPFSFLIQSIVRSKMIIFIISTLLFVFLAPLLTKRNLLNSFTRLRSIENVLSILFLMTVLSGFAVILGLQGDYYPLIRNVVVYLIPCLLLVAIPENSIFKLLSTVFYLTIFTGIAFSLIQVYSYSSKTPTYTEKVIYDYIAYEYGHTKGEFLGSYRPVGPTDHIHLTSLFLAISAVCSFVVMNTKKSFFIQLGFYLTLLGLWATGVRLSIITTLFALWAICFFIKNYSAIFKILLGSIVSIIILHSAAKNSQNFKMIYIQPIASILGVKIDVDEENIDYSEFVVTPAVTQLKQVSDESNLSQILFGVGFDSTEAATKGLLNDDIFWVQIFTNFGLLGMIIFYGFTFYMINKVARYSFEYKDIYFFALSLLLILMVFTTLHSGVLFRRIMFPLFILFLSIARKLVVTKQNQYK